MNIFIFSVLLFCGFHASSTQMYDGNCSASYPMSWNETYYASAPMSANGTYYSDMYCVTVFTVDDPYMVSNITFTAFDLDVWYDSVTIYWAWDSRWMSFSHDNPPEIGTPYSVSGDFKIIFYSDGSEQGKGFDAFVQLVGYSPTEYQTTTYGYMDGIYCYDCYSSSYDWDESCWYGEWDANMTYCEGYCTTSYESSGGYETINRYCSYSYEGDYCNDYGYDYKACLESCSWDGCNSKSGDEFQYAVTAGGFGVAFSLLLLMTSIISLFF